MKTQNPHTPLIQKIEDLITEAIAITPADAHQTMIIAGLHTARDFAHQHGEAHQPTVIEDTTATNPA